MKEKQRARHTDEKEKSAKHLHLIVIFAFTPQILIMCSGHIYIKHWTIALFSNRSL